MSAEVRLQATISRFKEAEEIRAKALGDGKSIDEAHEAAKKYWNAWAISMLENRKKIEDSGRWAEGRAFNDELAVDLRKRRATTLSDAPISVSDTDSVVRYGTEESRAWYETSTTYFSGCRFVKADLSSTPDEQFTHLAIIEVNTQTLNFNGFIFPGSVLFQDTIIDVECSFDGVRFHRDAFFRNSDFNNRASFDSTYFFGDTSFSGSTFHQVSIFNKSKFYSTTTFNPTTTSRPTIFEEASFFESVDFADKAWFFNAKFRKAALFGASSFLEAYFYFAQFDGTVDFSLVTFQRIAHFGNSRFGGDTSFNAIRSSGAFDLSMVNFKIVPDYIQAHFEEPPRLDTMTPSCNKRFAVPADIVRELPARWRALRRLAVASLDHQRHQDFLAGELTAERTSGGWATARSWLGLFYQVFSDFGRSTIRPFIWWSIITCAAAIFYLHESQRFRATIPAIVPIVEPMPPFAGLTMNILSSPPKCILNVHFDETPVAPDIPADTASSSTPSLKQSFSGLTSTVFQRTNALSEAMALAWHNAFVGLGAGQDESFRSYACLYGLERYGDNPVPYVPLRVALVSGAQKLFSGILIFLFGVALRNMLKVR